MYQLPSIVAVRGMENAAIIRLSGDDLLNSTNWIVWRERMYIMLQLCEVYDYTQGLIEKPNSLLDSQGARNWLKNDNYAKHLLTSNISTTEMMNLGRPGTSFECWKQLLALYENKTHDTIIAYTCNLHQLRAVDGDDIPKHLVQLRQYFLQINLTANPDFRISDAQFKVIISSSLPQSWDTFTEDYVGRRTDIVEINPKKLMNSQEFIGIIREEYRRRTGREEESTNLAIQKPRFKPPKPNLAQRISNNTSNSTQKWCSHCKRKNHNDADCHFLNDTPPCSFCGLKGHTDKTCRKKRKKEKDEKGKKRKSDDNGGGDAKRQKKDVANVVEEEAISFLVNGEDYNYDTFDVSNSLAMDERVSYYDEWVADTGTTSHITNQRDAFITYQALGDKIVSGVGGLRTYAHGIGTVEVESIHNRQKYLFRLENILYIPKNPNNLLSLGRWDTSGGRYTRGGGTITLITKDGKPIACGQKISNNLY
jgi:hypothetical protein